MDNRIHSTNLNPVDSAIGYLILIYWKVIYPLDSAFQRLRNRQHSITTHRIDVTAVRVGRAFVDIYIQTWCCHYKNFKASSLHTYVIFIIFALEFWSSLQGNVFEKPIHTYTLNTLEQKNYVFTQKKLYLLLYRIDIFSEIYQVYFSF